MDDTTCKAARGGVYDASKSKSQQSLGAYRLGMDYLGLGGNGDYTMETVAAPDNTQGQQTSLAEQLVAGINNTDYYVGYFGLGVDKFEMNDAVAEGSVAVLAEKTMIGSQSYGYTAGAYYGKCQQYTPIVWPFDLQQAKAGSGGMPLSLTLGGYDENRFVAHDTLFSLNASTKQPEVLITSITTSVSDAGKTPASWPAGSVALTSDGESATALIDSSTPFLWLPTSICDRFAVAFNLTWNETFGLYVFPDDGDSLEKFRAAPDLSVAFVLSSTGSIDDSAESLDDQATVTITVSANAFIQYAQAPFMGLAPGTPAVPYFPLRRVHDGGKIIIGRTFLQEAYLITNYEASTFSVHQATFPDEPLTNTSIKAIPPTNDANSNSPVGSNGNGLSREQLAGVVVGAFAAAMTIVMVVWWLVRRRKDQGRNTEAEGTFKDTDSLEQPGSPKTENGGLLSKISKSLPWSKSGGQDTRGQFTPSPYPVNYGTDPSREGYWTPSPLPPVELGARRVESTNGAAEFHPSGDDMAAYEIARMGLDPLPLDTEYDQSSSMQEHQFYESQQYTNSTAAAPRRPSTDLGLYNLFPGSPTPDNFSDGSSSPMTPYGDYRNEWNAHNMNHYPSTQPLVNNPQLTTTVRSNSTMSSSSAEPRSVLRSVSSRGSLAPPSPAPAVQRMPIDSSKVICLGPLPDNVQLPYPSSSSRTPRPPLPTAHHHPYGGDFFEPPPIPPSMNYRRNRVSTAETLGSNYTVEEEALGRITGEDIVHIPHLPERRYSWEN
ncbi:hypothetical protein SLS62_003929 [Diatrype stigma]|uniref:Peptidase A1 domain-containing protein n=1 Tax=Diatrype stigma TaxID=117547 RepID=A0AAN9YPL0_9PEZI